MLTESTAKHGSNSADAVAVAGQDKHAGRVRRLDRLVDNSTAADGRLRLVLADRHGVQSGKVDEDAVLAEVERVGPSVATVLGEERQVVLRAVLDLWGS